jgi:hypothetical protein
MGEWDGGMDAVGRKLLFNLLVKYEAMLKMSP